jgi:hypothetical protein
MIAGAVHCLDVLIIIFCITEIFSGSLESDTCYSKTVNEILVISFGRRVLFSEFHVQVDISLAACYLGHSGAHKCLSRTDHELNIHLQSEWLSFSIRKTLISSVSDRKCGRILPLLSH